MPQRYIREQDDGSIRCWLLFRIEGDALDQSGADTEHNFQRLVHRTIDVQPTSLAISGLRIKLRVQHILSPEPDRFHVRAGWPSPLHIDFEVPAERPDVLHSEIAAAGRRRRR